MRLIDADKMKADLLTVDPQYGTMIWWCITVLDAQPTMEPPRWIPVSERLPEKNGRYLCTHTRWGAYDVDWNAWLNGEWVYPSEKPIAWMPLPEPYEEGNNE